MNVDIKGEICTIREMKRIKKRRNHCQLKLWARVNVNTL